MGVISVFTAKRGTKTKQTATESGKQGQENSALGKTSGKTFKTRKTGGKRCERVETVQAFVGREVVHKGETNLDY